MSEAKFTIMFRHWLKANPLPTSAAFELKYTDTDRMNFAVVQEHQLKALTTVKYKQLLYKAPDDSRQTKPFDLFYLSNEAAYVVIKYPDGFYLIDVDDFIYEKNQSREKGIYSLTSARAHEISAYSVRL